MATHVTPVRLSARTLAQVAERVPVPAYDRSAVSTGIVHLGVGGFHRAHEAAYLDVLLGAGRAGDWGITGVGLMPQDERMAEVMAAQDGLYTLVVKHPDGSLEPRVIGSVVDYLFAPADAEAVLAVMSAPSTRIVSLTITEGGYHLNQSTGEFDDGDATLQADIAGFAEGPGHTAPTTAFGFLTHALARRRAAGTDPFTVMSCDNIAGNGDVARQTITAFADRCDADLGEWVRAHVRFPNSMVDRITPGTTDADREALAEQFGVQDAWPVVCEPFLQWALEDSFGAGRPPWEEAGVQVVDDVEPYELMKLRLLNAGHQALAYLGYLSGYRRTDEACGDELFRDFLRRWMDREMTPTLEPVPDVDLEDYKDTLLERFANPEVKDTLARLATDTSDRIPTFLVPAVRHNLEHDGEVRLSALVVAAWARYAEGTDEAGDPIEVADRRREAVTARAARQAEEPLAFLEDCDLFGDLADDERFTAPYLEALESLHSRGARRTLEAWLADDPA
ncbi:MAG: mannitol dehydrogenase family protein [Marmoricola sp.]|nr:mannitol dehydrogenase family protein [Marmoricola sp.]